eukprot:7006817-Alexandrium_andersonii.AAC.1
MDSPLSKGQSLQWIKLARPTSAGHPCPGRPAWNPEASPWMPGAAAGTPPPRAQGEPRRPDWAIREPRHFVHR